MDGPVRTAFASPGPRRHGFDDFWAAAECNHSYWDGYYYLNDDPEPRWFDGYEPDGQTDLAQETEHEEIRQQLDDLLQEWLERTDDPFEAAGTVADKYVLGHVNNIVPYTHGPDIIQEQERRRQERRAQQRKAIVQAAVQVAVREQPI